MYRLFFFDWGVKHAGSADMLAELYNTTPHHPPAEGGGEEGEERGLTLTHHFGCMKVVVVGGGTGVT